MKLWSPPIEVARTPANDEALRMTVWKEDVYFWDPMGKMLKMLRKDVAGECPIKGESPAKSCAAGPLTATRERTAHRNLGPWLCTCATPRRLSTACAVVTALAREIPFIKKTGP